MRREKRKMMFTLLFLLFLGLGIGYAALSTNLSIDGTSQITSGRWSIYFDNVVESTGIVTPNTAATISSSLTTVSYNVTLTNPGDFYEFTVDVVNDGTIDAMIDTISSKLNGVEITTLPGNLEYSVTYYDGIALAQYQVLEAGDTETYRIKIKYKSDLNPEDLNPNTTNLSFSFSVTYVQADEHAVSKPMPPIIIPVSGINDRTAFRSSLYVGNIKIINFDDEINPPANVIASWDVGVAQNGNVMAYITANATDNTKYDLYIQGDGALYANPDSSYLFYNMSRLDSINNIEALNTTMVTNMNGMFYWTGSFSSAFTLDLGDNFDTSNVTNMNGMFSQTAYNCTVFTLDLGSKFDTSNVTDMNGMFFATGYFSTVFTLDLGNKFDTSNVTDMGHMFRELGYSSTAFTLNLRDKFDTSQVTNMTKMFSLIAHNNPTFTLDISSFDFTNVTSYTDIFSGFQNTQKIYVKDASDRSWVIANGGSSYLTTSNVLIKS